MSFTTSTSVLADPLLRPLPHLEMAAVIHEHTGIDLLSGRTDNALTQALNHAIRDGHRTRDGRTIYLECRRVGKKRLIRPADYLRFIEEVAKADRVPTAAKPEPVTERRERANRRAEELGI